jgi:hypothetical protein
VIARKAGTTSSTGLIGVRTTDGEDSSGNHRSTGSSSAIRPSSTSIMTATAVTGLVTEATRNRASRGIGSAPVRSRTPATATSTSSWRATRATAPGSDPSFTWVSSRSCSLFIVHLGCGVGAVVS